MEKEELEKIIERAADRAAKKAIEAYQREQQAQESRKAYNMTFKYLKQYGNLISSTKNGVLAAGGAENEFLQLIEKAQTPTNAVIGILARGIAEMQEETEKSKFTVFEMYFFEKMTYEQITDKMPMGDSTPRRWVSELVNILAVKLFGIEAIHK
ncbi:hypothetical protein [Phascolarctobacterium sp.]|uniref:hypothetical protein n=1 Tax=Phascolarctobacterium sp. TaxID=2049039 RepID=UPI00386CEC80